VFSFIRVGRSAQPYRRMEANKWLKLVLRYVNLCLIFSLTFGAEYCFSTPEIRYDIRVTLDPEKKTLTGQERIVYISGADTPLNEIYVHLYPNAYRGRESTAGQEAEKKLRDFTLAHARASELGYIEIRSLKINNQSVIYEIDDTYMRVSLPKPFFPRDPIVIEIDFVTKIPGVPHRFRYKDSHFAIAQWYPKMAVYDNHGWHPDQYHLIGEFYGDFATYEVSITLPQEYYVGATGYLVSAIDGDNNIPPASITTSDWKMDRRKLKEAVADGWINPFKTLVFRAENVHDFAWVASPDYVKDQAEWNGVTVTALVLRKHWKGQWKDLLDFSLDALKFYSVQIGMYPYSHLTVAEAYSYPAGGMEYPMLSMIDPGAASPWTHLLEYVTAHEIGHNWWYGVVANDELNEPWLDEGFNEYYTVKYAEWKYPDGELYDLPGILAPLVRVPYRTNHEIGFLHLVASGLDTVIAQPACNFRDYQDYGVVVYGKGSHVLDMLSYVIGDSVFEEVMRTYYSQYCFKHPIIADFTKVAERVSGHELDWFFDQWLRTTKTCDYAVGDVSRSVEDTVTNEFVTSVEVKREGDIVMPVEVEATLTNGERVMQRIFADDRREIATFRTTSPVKKVVIDPRHRLLETNRLNNEAGFLPPLKLAGLFEYGEAMRSDRYVLKVKPSVWYNKVDKWKLGATLTGSYLQVQDRISMGVVYGTGTEVMGFQGSYSTNLGVTRNDRVGFHVYRDNGMRNYSIGLSLGRTPPLATVTEVPGIAWYPVLHSTVRLLYSDKCDSRYFDDEWYSLGKTVTASWRLKYIQKSYHGLTKLRFDFTSGLGVLGADYVFNRMFAMASQELRLVRTGEVICRLRGNAGYVFGQPPLHEKLHIAEGVSESTVDPLGTLTTQGGGGVRGYQEKAVLGTELLATNIELESERVKCKFVRPILFFDLGRVNGEGDLPLLNKVLYDAGIEFSILDMIYYSFPLWLSAPPDGEDEFNFRMVVTVRAEL
jgi:hypothetical protein